VTDAGTAIRVHDVSKRFVIRKEKSLKERLVNFGRSNRYKEDFFALTNVSVDIPAGATVGLIGPNGSGKSTLLKTIGGIIQPTSGYVQHRGRVAALLELGAGFHPDLTGRENVYLNAAILGISRAETEQNLPEILEFSGIGQFIDTQVKFYSSGMYVRLAFAVAVHVDPDILIVDEVLAVGDEPFQRKCMDRIRDLQSQGKTIVLVTHSLDQVAEFCDRVIVLESGSIVFDGEPGPAIQRLRKDFEVIRQHSADVVAVEVEERDTNDLTISKVELKSLKTNKNIDSIPSGEGIAVEITLSVPTPTDRWNIGMGIESSMGQVIFGTNTTLLKSKTPPIEGSPVFRFEVDSLPLGDGQYFVNASFGTLDAGELFRIPQAASFYVVDKSPNVGLLGAKAVGALVTSF
jgi:ABC-2 type transport system ATP-binding protein